MTIPFYILAYIVFGLIFGALICKVTDECDVDGTMTLYAFFWPLIILIMIWYTIVDVIKILFRLH